MKYTDWIYLLGVLAMVAIAGVYLYYWRRERQGNDTTPPRSARHPSLEEGNWEPPNPQPTTHFSPKTHNSQLTSLSIQAYERMVVFVERCGFQSLINRMPAGNLSARQLAEVFIEAIRTEFEYNLSQQIYISEASWQTVCDMKDQQSFIITQLVNTLPENAPGNMLSAALLAFMEADEKASIQPLVLDNLRKEARKNLQQS